jgi:hypothetical protein
MAEDVFAIFGDSQSVEILDAHQDHLLMAWVIKNSIT